MLTHTFAREAKQHSSLPEETRSQLVWWKQMALALPGSTGGTAKKMGAGNRPRAMRVAIPCTAPEMGLSDRLLLHSVFR